MYQQTRRQAGRAACPSVDIMDGQSVKTTAKITGLTWIVERSLVWLGRNRAIEQGSRVSCAGL